MRPVYLTTSVPATPRPSPPDPRPSPNTHGREAQRDAAPVLPENPNRQERAMKMNSAQIERTLTKLNTEALSAEAIPAGHPMMPQLERLFGDHTYFLDSRG